MTNSLFQHKLRFYHDIEMSGNTSHAYPLHQLFNEIQPNQINYTFNN